MSKSSWELINSWWLILPFAFLIYLNWIAFAYIGITARHRKWILYGVVYAIPFIVMSILGTAYHGKIISFNPGQIAFIIYLMGVISIIHAFYLREEYLVRLKALKYSNNDDKLRKKIAREYGLGNRISSDTQEHPTVIKDDKQVLSDEFVKDFPSKSVDINNDPEDLLSELPGVSVILAKKIIQLRRSGVYFDSAEDFGEALGLKPHIVEEIKFFIVVNPVGDEIKITKNKGRIVDI
jgi:DNA uptake protein ComE-like DNA-binding protein